MIRRRYTVSLCINMENDTYAHHFIKIITTVIIIRIPVTELLALRKCYTNTKETKYNLSEILHKHERGKV